MKCNDCGFDNSRGNTNCTFCGTPLTVDEPATQESSSIPNENISAKSKNQVLPESREPVALSRNEDSITKAEQNTYQWKPFVWIAVLIAVVGIGLYGYQYFQRVLTEQENEKIREQTARLEAEKAAEQARQAAIAREEAAVKTLTELQNQVYIEQNARKEAEEKAQELAQLAEDMENAEAEAEPEPEPEPVEHEARPGIRPAIYSGYAASIETNKLTVPSNSPVVLVGKMLELAAYNGGRDYEREIQQHKATLEQMPKPERGDRKTARLLNDQALELLKASQYDAAVQSLLNAARLDRSDVEIINNLGFAFLKQGNLDQAQNYLVTCLAMAPDRSAAWSNLADVLALKGNMQQSVAAYANVYRFSKNRVKTHQFLKDTNSKESNANLIQARQSAMNIAEKMYTDVVGP